MPAPSPAAPAAPLSVIDHPRDAAGLTYVYPVVSRRAQGVSVGINLNVNSACNWQCIYCQVPGLSRGGPPPIDLARLRAELDAMLAALSRGDYLQRHVPAGMRHVRDIALSGNGEPTTAAEFPEVVALIGDVLARHTFPEPLKIVLISNGSLMHQARVRAGITHMAALHGEVWFKLDRATPQGMRTVNGTRTAPSRTLRNLALSCACCPTWVQTCFFALDGHPPPDNEIDAYLDVLRDAARQVHRPAGVLLYGVARPSMQAGAGRISPLPGIWFETLAARIEALGYACHRHP
jgi:wyosine [tRNA(Phe)-imidazoG37] synthetase (radical SAM superfamily)